MTALLVVLAIRARFEAGEERIDVPAVTQRPEVER
jgi:multicomponent K+:H+ antiporter subunit C